MKKFFIFCTLILFPVQALAAEEIRYKMYIVDKLDNYTENVISQVAAGVEKNLILLDTKTGNTWLLTTIGTEVEQPDGNSMTLTDYAWKSLHFRVDSEPIWPKSKLSLTPQQTPGKAQK